MIKRKEKADIEKERMALMVYNFMIT